MATMPKSALPITAASVTSKGHHSFLIPSVTVIKEHPQTKTQGKTRSWLRRSRCGLEQKLSRESSVDLMGLVSLSCSHVYLTRQEYWTLSILSSTLVSPRDPEHCCHGERSVGVALRAE